MSNKFGSRCAPRVLRIVSSPRGWRGVRRSPLLVPHPPTNTNCSWTPQPDPGVAPERGRVAEESAPTHSAIVSDTTPDPLHRAPPPHCCGHASQCHHTIFSWLLLWVGKLERSLKTSPLYRPLEEPARCISFLDLTLNEILAHFSSRHDSSVLLNTSIEAKSANNFNHLTKRQNYRIIPDNYNQ